MKILFGFSYYQYPVDIREKVNKYLERIKLNLSINIDSYPLTLDYPGPRLNWRELDRKWKLGDKKLMSMYEKLALKAQDYDVFINWNGINIHPKFLKYLDTYNVFGCFDDPESSDDLSKPVATAYDLCMVGNIAEIDTYKKWGVKNVEWWPMGFHDDDYDSYLTKEMILGGERDVDISLLCERESGWRKERLDKFVNAFPEAKYYGKGWPMGFLPEVEKKMLYQRTKIGPNFHNSTGPINFRTFILPANGVMQICDNKDHLSKIYDLDKEVVGFNNVEECIEKCRYYLDHDKERRQIAAAGWERAMKDYNEVAVFERVINCIGKYRRIKQKGDYNEYTNHVIFARKHYFQTYFWLLISESFTKIISKAKRIICHLKVW